MIRIMPITNNTNNANDTNSANNAIQTNYGSEQII